MVEFTQYREAIRVINEHLKPLDELKVIPLEADPDQFKLEQSQVNLRNALLELFENRQTWGQALGLTNQMIKMYEEAPHYLLFSKAEFLAELEKYDEAKEVIDELDGKVDDKERIKIARAGIL